MANAGSFWDYLFRKDAMLLILQHSRNICWHKDVKTTPQEDFTELITQDCSYLFIVTIFGVTDTILQLFKPYLLHWYTQ